MFYALQIVKNEQIFLKLHFLYQKKYDSLKILQNCE